MSNTAEVTPITSAPRTKSQETILKQKLRGVRKEIEVLGKKVAKFKTMQKEMADAETTLKTLQDREASLKADIIKELDLA